MSTHPHGLLSERSLRPLFIAFSITVGIMVLEIVVGLLSHSLALLADAGHMATDAAALAMTLVASWIVRQPATRTKTYGFYRMEILAAFLNGLTLWGIVIWIGYEAIQRFAHPPVIRAPMMLLTAIIGLAANLGCSWVLRPSQSQSLNMKSAYLHVLADALGSVSVIGAAAVIWLTTPLSNWKLWKDISGAIRLRCIIEANNGWCLRMLRGLCRSLVVGLVPAFLFLNAPGNLGFQRHSSPAGACGTGTVACCCGVKGGCGTCPTEQSTAAQKETSLLVIKLAGCPGPVQEAATPGGGPRYILPNPTPLVGVLLPAGRIFIEKALLPDSIWISPEPPPPRFFSLPSL